jgi:hypothetical protein
MRVLPKNDVCFYSGVSQARKYNLCVCFCVFLSRKTLDVRQIQKCVFCVFFYNPSVSNLDSVNSYKGV